MSKVVAYNASIYIYTSETLTSAPLVLRSPVLILADRKDSESPLPLFRNVELCTDAAGNGLPLESGQLQHLNWWLCSYSSSTLPGYLHTIDPLV